MTGQIVPANPAHSVRGPSHVVKVRQTSVLPSEEARTLTDSVEITTHAGLHDRALIGPMVFSFARIGATLGMKVKDLFVHQHIRNSITRIEAKRANAPQREAAARR